MEGIFEVILFHKQADKLSGEVVKWRSGKMVNW